MAKKTYRWAAAGDANAFFGLMLDNIADLLLTVGLLSAVFGFPTIVALRYMVPGTAIGVLVGDLLYFWMAIKVMIVWVFWRTRQIGESTDSLEVEGGAGAST